MIERDLILIGDQAWTPEERAAHQNRRKHEYERERQRYATDPEWRERRLASQRRRYAERIEEMRRYHREWMRRYRARQQAEALRVTGSLHSLRCTGPTTRSGCRCHKLYVVQVP